MKIWGHNVGVVLYGMVCSFSGDPNCPVALYKAYADKRPDSMCLPESRFYLGTNKLYSQSGKWFTCQPLGKNKLGQIASTMSDKAGFQARHVNHSGRKTCISKLLDANIPPTEVAQLSGHKNIMSLNHYNTVNLQKQIQMSSIIHGRGDNIPIQPTATVTTSKQQTEPVPSTSSSSNFDQDFDKESDDELINASQQIEEALKSISSYEDITNATNTNAQAIDLPIIQSPGGSLQLTNQSFKPQSLFNNCKFNGNVTIVLKQ